MPKNSNPRPARPIVVIVPCSAAKADGPAAARDLYTSANFRNTLDAAGLVDDDCHVLILSALHGLLELDTEVAPYDVKIGDAGAITAATLSASPLVQLLSDLDADVYTMLPKAYRQLFDAACRPHYLFPADVFEAAAGIGEHRGIAATIRRTAAAA